MTCYAADYQGELQPAAEIAEINWFSHSQVQKVDSVDQIIFGWLYERELLAE